MRQASEAQREKELERDRKNEGDIFVGETRSNFVAAVRKLEMPEATRVKMSDSEKKVNKNTYDISSLTRTFLEASRCSRAKQQNNQESCPRNTRRR